MVAHATAPVLRAIRTRNEGGFYLRPGIESLRMMLTPRVGKRRGHTYCNYAQMGASVCLCISDVMERE